MRLLPSFAVFLRLPVLLSIVMLGVACESYAAAPRTVLITGATSGLGAAAAQRFARDGWKVIATGRRAERLQPLVKEFGEGHVYAAAFDLRDPAAMDKALAGLPENFRHIDLLINNAGLALGTGPAQKSSLKDWRTMIDTNIVALVTLTHKLLPELIQRRGQIINIGSVSGLYPYPGSNVYGGTKAFVDQFSMGLRSDLAGTGVRVTVVEPGAVETEFTAVRTGGDKAAVDKLYSKANNVLQAQDIAESLAWLASLPPRMNVNRLEVMATNQAFAALKITPLAE